MTVVGRRWLVAGVGLGMVVAIAGGVLTGMPVEFEWVTVQTVVYLVAGITVLRVPENRVSWVLLAIAFGFVLFRLDWLPQVGGPILFLGAFVFIFPGLGVLIPLWFPTGDPPTSRWRWVEYLLWISLAGVVVSQLVGLAYGTVNGDVEGTCADVASCLELTSVSMTLLAIGAAVVALIVRWLRSEGLERQQMKGVVFAFFVFAVGIAVEFGGNQEHPVGLAFLIGGALLIPIAIGVAIVRYRLYDIDRIISRTVSYGIVVGLSLGGVAGVSLVAGAQFDEPWVVAATTLGVAAAFNPLRRRVQSWVDRRFNRSRYDAENVVDEFAGSLRDRVDPEGVVDGWVEVVDQTMQPSAVGVWVRS